jgi:ribonucleoside-triphosphate reductase
MEIPGGEHPYYTNSTQLPVEATDDIFEALEMQDGLQTLYTGGTVLHGFIGEAIEDTTAVSSLVRKIAYGYKLPYFTITPTYSVCEEHGYLSGDQGICPKCGKETEVYSRIVGYYRPVKNWNDGKKAEYDRRRTYDNNDFSTMDDFCEEIEAVRESETEMVLA